MMIDRKKCLHHIIRQIERTPYRWKIANEAYFAIASSVLIILYTANTLLYGANPPPWSGWGYIVYHSIFTGISFSSVLILATPAGETWVCNAFLRNGTFGLALIPSTVILSYVALGIALDFPAVHKSLSRLEGLILVDTSALFNLFLFLLLIVLSARFGFYLAKRNHHNSTFTRLLFKDLPAILIAVAPYLLFQEFVPLAWCFSTPLAIVVMMYATGLGRKHFFYSFLPRSASDIVVAILLLCGGLGLFTAVAWCLGTFSYTGTLWNIPWHEVYSASIVWLYIVGISEEVIFRCCLLVLLVDTLRNRKTATCNWTTKYPMSLGIILCSLLFGLVHIFHGLTFALLAVAAGLLYGLSFALGKTLFGPVLLHGVLNMLILMNFRLLA